MQKALTVLSSVAIILSSAALYFSQTKSELVYVDVNKLIEGYSRTKVEKKIYDKKVASMQSEVDTLINNWQKELQSYEKEKSNLAPSLLTTKQELLKNKQQQIRAYRENTEKKIQEENNKVSQTLINDINDYVKEYGKQHQYQIIFGASGTGNIMYAAEGTDLTETILKGLNSEYDKK